VEDPREPSKGRPKIAIQQGGVLCAHHLLLARYYMFSQVYLHPVRQAYDFHLRDFFKASLPQGLLPIDPKQHLDLSDIEIEGWLRKSSIKEARPIRKREHARVIHQANSLLVGEARSVHSHLERQFPDAQVYLSENRAKKVREFLVLDSNDAVLSSLGFTDLNVIPASAPHYVFIDRNHYDRAMVWKKEQLLPIQQELAKRRAKEERDAKRRPKPFDKKGDPQS